MNWNKNGYTYEEFARMREDAMRRLSEMARQQQRGSSPSPRPSPEAPPASEKTAPPPESAPSPEAPPEKDLVSIFSGLLGGLSAPSQNSAAPSEAPDPAFAKTPSNDTPFPQPDGPGPDGSSGLSSPSPDALQPSEASRSFETGAQEDTSQPEAPPSQILPAPAPALQHTNGGEPGQGAFPFSPDPAASGQPEPAPAAFAPDTAFQRFFDQIPRDPASYHPDQFIRAEDEENYLPEMKFPKKK